MGFNCPHCTKEIPGAMTQESHEQRLNAKTEENKELKARLTEAQAASAGINEIKAERDRLAAEVKKRDRQAERAAAFDEAGIPNTPAIRKGFELVYDSEMSGVAEPTPIKDWLGKEETKGHPLLSVHYVKPQQGQQAGATTTATATGQTEAGQGAAGQQQSQGASSGQAGATTTTTATTARPQGGLTNVDRGAAPPPTGQTGPKTPAEVAAYFRSEAYRALPLDKQREEKARLAGQLRGTTQSG